MKIVSVMTTTSQGGAEFAAVEMLDALAEQGHQTVMLSDLPSIGRGTRVRVAPVALGPKLSTTTWRGLVGSVRSLRRELRRALEREAPYDVLLVHYKKEQLLARLLPVRLRATLVWAEWGPVPVPLRRGPARWVYVEASRPAALIMAVSTGTADSLRAVGVAPEKIAVVPNVVRADELGFTAAGRARMRASLGIPEHAPVVGCVSRFHPKKRNDVVVEAVKQLGEDVHLLMAGDGEEEASLRAQAEPLGDRAHFVPTPREEIVDVLSAFDLSVFCPSPTEGAPRAVILSMLAERPCLATGAEGVRDLIASGSGTIVAPENDPTALAASLRDYLEDPERRRREGAEARRRAEAAHDAPVVARRIARLIEGRADGAALARGD